MSERDMRVLLEQLARRLGLSWADVISYLRDQNTTSTIEDRIEAGDYYGAVQEIDAAAARFAADTHTAYVVAGNKASAWLDAKVPDALIHFDQANPRAVARAKANQYDLILGFTQEQREITRTLVTDGHQRGANPREVARDLRDSIGLTPTQSQWVVNYRRSLESGDFDKALGYELSSGTADRSVTAARRKGTALTATQIDKATEAFRKNAIAYRAEVIARTESLAAAHDGTADAYDQAIARGDVDQDSLVKTWHSRAYNPKRSRKDHYAMDDKSVGIKEDFVLPDGTRMSGPGDRRGGARHCAGCGCCSSVSFAR